MSEPLLPGDAESELPPLRVHHFFLWTAVAAVLLSIQKLFLAGNPFLDQETMPSNLAGVGFSAMGVVWQSMTLCTLGLGIYWYRHGKEFFDLPGHGLLVTLGIAYGIQLVMSLLFALPFFLFDPSAGGLASVATMAVSGIFGLGMLVVEIYLNLRFARQFADFPRWRVLFLARAIMTVLQFVLPFLVGCLMAAAVGPDGMQWMFPLMFLPYLFVGVYLVWTVVKDHREGYRFHWSHFAGVVAVLGGMLSGVFGAVWAMFYFAMG